MIRGGKHRRLRFQYRVEGIERQPPFLGQREFPMVLKKSLGNLTEAWNPISFESTVCFLSTYVLGLLWKVATAGRDSGFKTPVFSCLTVTGHDDNF